MAASDCQEGACGTSGLQARRHCLIGWKWGPGRFGGCGCRAGSTVPWPRTVDVAMGPHGGSHDERHRPLCAIIRFAHESCTTRVVPAAPPAVPGPRGFTGGLLVRTKSGFQCVVRGWRAPGAAPCPRLRAITVRRIYIYTQVYMREAASFRKGGLLRNRRRPPLCPLRWGMRFAPGVGHAFGRHSRAAAPPLLCRGGRREA